MRIGNNKDLFSIKKVRSERMGGDYFHEDKNPRRILWSYFMGIGYYKKNVFKVNYLKTNEVN